MAKRIQFVVDDKVFEALEKLKHETEADSLVDVFRNALKTYEWVVEQFKEGREVVSKPADNSEKHFHAMGS